MYREIAGTDERVWATQVFETGEFERPKFDCMMSTEKSLNHLKSKDEFLIANVSTYSVILLPAHPASFVHKFLFQRVPASPGMQ